MIEILLFITLLLTLSIILTTCMYGIGPTPTSPRVREKVLAILPNKIEGTIYELGAGWGTLAFALADHYKDFSVVAIEVSPIPWLWMHLRNCLNRRSNLKIIWGDFFKLSLSFAGLIVCYLYPKAMVRLEKKIAVECKNTWVITHTFAFPEWKPQNVVIAHDMYHTPVYLYEI